MVFCILAFATVVNMRFFFIFSVLFLEIPTFAQSHPFVELTEDKHGVLLDIRYATPQNFTGATLYECGRCFLHPMVAKALMLAVEDFKKQGYKIILFDCYRPLSIQHKLWKRVPDSRYVTPPTKGSMHNRGAAIDLTLQEIKTNKALDMGTPYDFFGQAAYMDYQGLSEGAFKNRKILHTTLIKYGFKPIRTEWWHFSFSGSGGAISDWTWTCP
jgi:D-alanyl-D-alanine dipeptidase